MNSKVYVTQEGNKDYSGATAFGELVFLTNQDYSNSPQSPKNQELSNRLRFLLRNFDPDRDWIVCGGSPYVVAMVFLILGMDGAKRVNVLRWDNRDYVYRPLHLGVNEAALI